MNKKSLLIDKINNVLSLWRQGDCSYSEKQFVFQTISKGQCDFVTEKVEGFAVITQTCDIIKSADKRPFIEVAALVKVDKGSYKQIAAKKMPRFTIVPALQTQLIVADLDRIMTVHKSIVADWTRIVGCNKDDEKRAFARSLIRKRGRTAFPHSFNEYLAPLQAHLINTEDTDEEGRILNEILEIRAQPNPDWDHDKIEVTLWFLFNQDYSSKSNEDKIKTLKQIEMWIDLLNPSDFIKIDHQVTTHAEMSAEDYLASDLLDYEQLS